LQVENIIVKLRSRAIQLICLLLLGTLTLHAQPSLETNIWYFGNLAGLDFNSGTPAPLNNGVLNTFEGTASIADRVTGRLLFYTDGRTVYDSTHTIMMNGSNLFGHYSSTQSGVIVPDPGSSTLYYVFTVAAQAGLAGFSVPNLSSGVCYSVVDMTLNGGLGAVTTKNVALVTPASEKISAVRHCNGVDVWVLTHEWNSDAFYAYLVTATGVQPPVISHSGIIHQDIGSGQNAEAIGYMKAAPDQQHIGLCTFYPMNTIQLFDFDNVLGIVSNPITITMPVIGTYGGPYGCSFSPDGTRFYAEFHNYAGAPNYVFQYDMTLGSAAAIVGSQAIVASTSAVSYGALQLASDGKMYMATFSNNSLGGPLGSPTIDRFDNPNALGMASGYVANAVFLGGGLSIWGLPDYIESFFSPPATTNFNDTTICTGSTVNFNPTYQIVMDSIRWDFDDPASGALNSAVTPAASHTFATAGVYDVALIVHYNCHHDTIRKQVTVNDLVIFLGNDTSLCTGSALTLDPQYPNASYLWSTGATTQSIGVSTSGQVWIQVTDGLCFNADTINVSFNPPPVVILGNDTTICSGDSVTLDAGNAGAAFLWSNGMTTQTITVASTGNYFVTADLTGCKDDDTLQVTVVVPPPLSLGNDTVLCNGQALQLNASAAGYSNLWSTGSTNTSINVSITDDYAVLLDNGICSVTDTINVQFVPPPVADIGNDTTICSGQQVTLDAGNPGASYLWSTGATTQTITAAASGSYMVTVDLTACVDKDTMVLTVNLPPAFSLGNDTVLCSGESVQLSAAVAGYSNTWSTGDTTVSITISTAGPYWLTLDDGICTAADTMQLQIDLPPVVNIGNDTTLCTGQALQLDAGVPLASYLWNTGATTQTISVTVTGNYFLNVTAGACTRSDTMHADFMTPTAFTLGPDTSLCEDQSVIIDPAIPGYSYLWNTGATTQAILVDTTGQYSMQFDDGICLSYDSIQVSFISYPVVDLGPDTSWCDNVPVTLDAGNTGATYAWSSGETTQDIQVTAAGAYWVVAAYSQCMDGDTVDLSLLPAPVVDLGNDTALCPGDVVVLDAGNPGSQILWDDGDQSPVKTFTSTGTYIVTVTNSNGCLDEDTIELNTHGCEFYLFVPNTFSPNGDTRNDIFHVVPYNVLHIKLAIFNRWGESVFITENLALGWNGKFNNTDCPEDIYAVTIDYDGLDETGNLIKKKKNTTVLLLR